MPSRKHDYVPTADFPHIPKANLARLLRKGSLRTDGGCQLWRGLLRPRHAPKRPGTQRDGRSTLSILRPDGSAKHLTVNRLAWWLHHGAYPASTGWLSTTCGDLRCIAQDHLRLRSAPKVMEAWPHVTDAVLRQRLDDLSQPGPGGCRLWTGTRHRAHGRLQAGMLRISVPDGSSQHLFAHKLAWFLVHRRYPKEPEMLAHACGQVACINPAHLRLISRQAQRGLSDAQVAEARAAYWAPRARLSELQLTMAPPTAVQFAAWSLGMSRATIEAVVAGRRVAPSRWRGYAKSVEHVLRAVALFGPLAQLHRQAHEGKVSVETLAKRYGSNVASMHSALNGVAYAHVPMPQEAKARVQRQKIDAAQAERSAAQRQAEVELDKLYAATLSPQDVALATMTKFAVPQQPPPPARRKTCRRPPPGIS